MCKKFFAAILSVLFLLNVVYTSGLVETDPKKLEHEKLNQEQLSDYALYAAVGLGVIFAGSFIAGLLSDTSGGTENSTDDGELPVKSWLGVAILYFKAAEEEKRARGFTAEYYEHMADCHRCHARSESISETERFEHYLRASSNFESASYEYKQRAQGYNVRSYECQINSAKAAEMKAKYEEMCVLMGIQRLQESNDHYVDMRAVCAKAWGEVIGKKSSYDAYAKAKQLEYVAISPIVIASAWRDVKNDQALKESFSEVSWEAYKAFAEANRQEWLLKAGQSSKQDVFNAWMQACEKDKICAKKWNSPIYRAFAAEAYMRAQDANKNHLEIAVAGGDVQNNQPLKESPLDDLFEAYEAFSKAHRLAMSFNAGQSSKEDVSDAWMQASKKYGNCAEKWNSSVYRAFAAEAYQRAQDVLKAT